MVSRLLKVVKLDAGWTVFFLLWVALLVEAAPTSHPSK